MNEGIKKICVIDSVYTFLVFVIYNIDHLEEYFFVFWKNIPQRVFDAVPNKIRNSYPLGCISSPYHPFRNYSYKRDFKKVMCDNHLFGLPACGQDHLPFSRCLLNFTDITFEEYEDGIESYIHKKETIRFKWLRKLVASDYIPSFAFSERVKRIYLTHPELSIDDALNKKVEWINLLDKWVALPPQRKRYICDLFGLVDLSICKEADTLVLTRPLSEDGFCTEVEKINMVQEILDEVGAKNAIIKPHYRETTNYEVAIQGVFMMSGKFPIELFLLQYGSQFSHIISVGKCSVETFVGKYLPNVDYITIER